MKNNSKIMMDINNMEDIKKLKKNPTIKYINLNITSPNLEVIYYLLENGKNYLFTEKIDNIHGYIYVPFKIFEKSQNFILDVINSIPPNLNKIEVARYFYITIGKNIGYDINISYDKNETLNLEHINTINNIWGSIYNTKGTALSLSKLYLYLCRLMNIQCELIKDKTSNELKNKLTINNRKLEVDITKDIPYIQAGFKTKHFTGYDDNLIIDKKIFYIQDNYNEVKINNLINKINYSNPDIFTIILQVTEKVIDISRLKPIELGIIYKTIFSKYCPNYEIFINNLYILNEEKQKEHFILISYDNKSYSYNYYKNNFVEISINDIIDNINNQKIGIYLNEDIPFITNKKRII